MSTDHDVCDAPVVDAPTAPRPRLSQWLREEDARDLAAIARTARLAGRSFGGDLRRAR